VHELRELESRRWRALPTAETQDHAAALWREVQLIARHCELVES
jgi:hypothetical protein